MSSIDIKSNMKLMELESCCLKIKSWLKISLMAIVKVLSVVSKLSHLDNINGC